jgi:two-component system NtrC family sensor kinase
VRAGRRLRRLLVAGLLLVSAVPFLLMGGGAWVVFRHLAIDEALQLYRAMVRAHAAAIDAYIAEQVRTVELISRTHTLEDLSDSTTLREVFASVAAVQGNSFVDLGVIDEQGRHLAYVGPYDLLDRNYREAEWFREVMDRGTSVSDAFLGFRQSSHSVVAVLRRSGQGRWILRATLDNHSLYALVRSLAVGTGGDVFLVNREGVYQTPPRSGDVLGDSGLTGLAAYGEVLDARLDTPGGKTRQVATRLEGKDWLLVVRQTEREILAPVTRAVGEGGLIALYALLAVFVGTLVVTARLIGQVERANRERDLLYADLVRTARMASLGEMATGLAHEINNPLAILSAEHANLRDRLSDQKVDQDTSTAIQVSLRRCDHQVERCGGITRKMLRFGGPTESPPSATDIEPVLGETVALLGRRALDAEASVSVSVAADLPPAWLDAGELEQVVLNLVGNALDAVRPGGAVRVLAGLEQGEIVLRIVDDGCGIEERDLERVFEPFFTTKPPGAGTGLGLAVVHGIVRGWGGTISVESEPGVGTTFTLQLPVAAELAVS